MKLILAYAVFVAIGYLLRKKIPVFCKPAVYIFLPTVLFSPLALFGILFGLTGSNRSDYLLMGIGYVIVLVFSLAGMKNQKLLLLSFFGISIAALGAYRDKKFWAAGNANLCTKLRADTYCVESSIGFSCSQKSSLGGFSTANVCSKRYTDAELEVINAQKRQAQIQSSKAQGIKSDEKLPNSDYVSRATNLLEKIIKQIIASPNPESLNFENQLKAIYNCINSEYENSLKAEAFGNMYLGSIAKTPEQIRRYRAYVISKGRVSAEGAIDAALPSGENQFNCTYLKQFSN